MSKISELSDGGSLLASDYLIVVRSGGNVKVRLTSLDVNQIDLDDNEFIRLGNSQDLTLVHDTSNSIINQAGIGNLLIQKAGTTKASITANGLEFPDNSKAIFGAGSDLQIYHDGSSSYITENGDGVLRLRSENGDGVGLYGAANAIMLFARNGAEVDLRHNGLQKLVTTATGIDVTGTVLTDELESSGAVKVGSSENLEWSAYSAGTSGVLWTGNGTSNTLDAYTTGSLRMRIDSAGNVGIGTSSPDYKLSIGGAFQSVNTDLISVTDTATIYRGTPDGTGFEHAKILSGRDSSTFTYGSFLSFYTEGKNSGTTDASTEAMRIDASGNVNIYGTDNRPLAITSFNTASAGAGWDLDATSTNGVVTVSTGGTERMRIDSVGNAGFGVSPKTDYETNYKSSLEFPYGGLTGNTSGIETALVSNSYRSADGSWKRLRAGYAARAMLNAGSGSDPFTITYAGTSSAGSVISWNEAARIDASGNLLVNETGVSGNAEKLRITSGGTSSATAAALFNDSAGTELFVVRSDGAFRTGSGAVSPYNNTAAVTANCFINTDGTLLRATSSRRYKKDISDARFGLSDLLNLRPVNYKGINSEVDKDTIYAGLIAEEVHDAGLTEFVEYNKENQPDALRYQHMVSLCIKAIQEQQATIEALTARITALES
jgi:hypothetical protein